MVKTNSNTKVEGENEYYKTEGTPKVSVCLSKTVAKRDTHYPESFSLKGTSQLTDNRTTKV